MKRLYTLITYSAEYIDDQETPLEKKVFPHLNNREVVGIMKTVMDNLKPNHVDIMLESSNVQIASEVKE